MLKRKWLHFGHFQIFFFFFGHFQFKAAKDNSCLWWRMGSRIIRTVSGTIGIVELTLRLVQLWGALYYWYKASMPLPGEQGGFYHLIDVMSGHVTCFDQWHAHGNDLCPLPSAQNLSGQKVLHGLVSICYDKQQHFRQRPLSESGSQNKD